MAGRKTVGPKLLGELDQISELHTLVAQAARYRSAPARILVSEMLDNASAEPAFVVEHIMGDADTVADGARVVDVLARAAGSGALGRLAVVVKLERNTDDLRARARSERGHDGAIDAA